MKKPDVTWKIFSIYMLILLFVLLCGSAKAQIQLAVFNAEWNSGNDVRDWAFSMEDCQTYAYVDINGQKDMQKKHGIAVIPTIIIFKDDEEVARFQADLSFKMLATREEVQEVVDEIIMSDF